MRRPLLLKRPPAISDYSLVQGLCGIIVFWPWFAPPVFKETSVTVELKRSLFGTTANGSEVELFTFTHIDGLVLSVINFGCIIQSLLVPDRDGVLDDVVLGYDTLAEYEADKKYLGCVVGRYANRIAGGKFTLQGVEYQLETNSHGNHIHGGGDGFHKQVWQASVEEHNGLPQLVLQHSSAHMHGGYPGNICLLYTSPSPRDATLSRMPSSA